MNGFTAWLQQAIAWVHAKAAATAGAVSAVAGNKPEPARQVVIVTLVAAALLVFAPRILKKFGK